MERRSSVDLGATVVACVWGADPEVELYLSDIIASAQSGARVLIVNPVASSAPFDGVETMPGIAGAAEGEGELLRYSLPGLFSTAPPAEALRVLYPGLRELSRTTVPILSPQALRKAIGEEGAVRLVVKTPGGERATFEAIDAAIGFERVSGLRLWCGAERFFDGGWSVEDCLHWLAERHFRVTEHDETDADWPVYTLDADPTGRRIADLSRALIESRAEAERLTAELVQRADRIAALEAEVVDRAQQATEIVRLTGEIERLTAALGQRDARLAAIETEAEARAAQAVAREREIERLQVELRQREARLEEVEADCASRADALAASEERHAAAVADLTVALRMQALAQGDLNDLRARLVEVDRQRRTHVELLRKLTPRLQLAAGQLAEMLNSPPPAEAAETLAPPARKTKRKSGPRAKGKG